MSVTQRNHAVTVGIGPWHDGSVAPLFREAIQHEISAQHEECLRWFCEHPDTPGDLLLEIYESGHCLDELGHRQGPRILLEKLANEANYPEAILTLAIQFYTDSSIAVEEFNGFLRRHADNDWMLETLVRRQESSAEKERLLHGTILLHPEADRLRHLMEVNRLSHRAARADDLEEIERLYSTGEPDVWLALAGNSATPRRLLERLAEAADVRLARRIRNGARQMLGTKNS